MCAAFGITVTSAHSRPSTCRTNHAVCVSTGHRVGGTVGGSMPVGGSLSVHCVGGTGHGVGDSVSGPDMA
eukprot:2287683-Rhodomonas_salina.1